MHYVNFNLHCSTLVHTYCNVIGAITITYSYNINFMSSNSWNIPAATEECVYPDIYVNDTHKDIESNIYHCPQRLVCNTFWTENSSLNPFSIVITQQFPSGLQTDVTLNFLPKIKILYTLNLLLIVSTKLNFSDFKMLGFNMH